MYYYARVHVLPSKIPMLFYIFLRNISKMCHTHFSQGQVPWTKCRTFSHVYFGTTNYPCI